MGGSGLWVKGRSTRVSWGRTGGAAGALGWEVGRALGGCRVLQEGLGRLCSLTLLDADLP